MVIISSIIVGLLPVFLHTYGVDFVDVHQQSAHLFSGLPGFRCPCDFQSLVILINLSLLALSTCSFQHFLLWFINFVVSLGNLLTTWLLTLSSHVFLMIALSVFISVVQSNWFVLAISASYVSIGLTTVFYFNFTLLM